MRSSSAVFTAQFDFWLWKKVRVPYKSLTTHIPSFYFNIYFVHCGCEVHFIMQSFCNCWPCWYSHSVDTQGDCENMSTGNYCSVNPEADNVSCLCYVQKDSAAEDCYTLFIQLTNEDIAYVSKVARNSASGELHEQALLHHVILSLTAGVCLWFDHCGIVCCRIMNPTLGSLQQTLSMLGSLYLFGFLVYNILHP